MLSWRLSNTLTTEFCVEALREALARFGKPGIFNTDQGAQFTSDEFTQMLSIVQEENALADAPQRRCTKLAAARLALRSDQRLSSELSSGGGKSTLLKINPARRLYERMGFQRTHEDRHKVYMRLEPGG